MKLKHLLDRYTEDLKKVAEAFDCDPRTPAKGTPLSEMYFLLRVARQNRAYDDSHPFFANGTWKRILPFDGSDYCEYYEDGGNDDHLRTLLTAILRDW